MSPEQAEGKTVDERSDIFSLGIIFYEMLSGQRPFLGESPASTLSAILKDDPKSLAELDPTLPRDLVRIVKRCLMKEPDRRFQTAKDVRNELEELREALSSGELEVPQSSAAQATATWKFRLAAGIGVLTLCALGAYVLLERDRSPAEPLRLTNPTQVTSALGVEQLPTWSPEGRRLAFESDLNGNEDIWVAQLGGSEPVNLTGDHTGRDRDPAWSPDGSQIAFKSTREGGGCFVMSALGGPARRVGPATSGPGGPAWSADGSQLACPTMDDESRPHLQITTLSTQESRLLAIPGQYPAWDLSWSPDGRFFGHVEAINPDADTTRLWLVGASDDEAIPLTDGTFETWSPTWLGEEQALLYVSRRGGTLDLWMQELERDGRPRGAPRAVTTGLGITSAALSPDGTKLAYAKGGRFANVWRVPILDDREATWSDAEQLTVDQAFVEFTDVSADGKRLVVNSNRTGNPDLWVLPASGGAMQPLTAGPEADWRPVWSPDGGTIAFYSSRQGNRDIYTMPSEGGPARQLTTNEGGDIMPSWSPDGTEIAYVSIRAGNYDVWVMSAEGENQRRLTEHAGMDNMPAWSPDGQWIAYASQRAIWRISPEGGDPERLTDGGFNPKWDPNGETIYFRDNGIGTPTESLCAIDIEDRRKRLVADLSQKRGSLGSFSLSTDGSYLYFTWEEKLGDIWVMDVVRE
jgi:Tol biopolymer transport system component